MDKVIRKTEETQTKMASSESKTKAMPARKRRLDPVKKVHATEYEMRSIIAMKGHPFTRKTELATAVSTSLRCPILCLDDFLDVLTPGNYCQRTSPSSISCTPDPFLQPQDLAFRIICQVAKSNLLKGFKEIIIDSQLSSRSHLDQLIELAKSLPRTRLVIFECKTDNPYQWQTQVERYLQFNRPENNKWYKSKSWEDVEKAIKDGFDERSQGYKVSKLVLDPISDFHGSDLYIVKTLPFIDAVKYMITRDETDGPDLVLYSRWRQGQYLTSEIGGNQKLGSCRAGSGHYITNYAEEGLEYEANCMACGDQIAIGAAAYTCHHCSLALHKECAELLDGINIPTVPENLTLLRLDRGRRKLNPELQFRCSSCQGKVDIEIKIPSSNSPCGDCLFTTHLKSRWMPTVIRHDCDDHFLTIVFSILSPYEAHTQCKACGDGVNCVWYSCKICGVAYHARCLTNTPVRVDHEHGGHHHRMLLQYSSKKAEDYICDVCFERGDRDRRDPRNWFYSCQECPYVAHVDCGCEGKTDIPRRISIPYTYLMDWELLAIHDPKLKGNTLRPTDIPKNTNIAYALSMDGESIMALHNPEMKGNTFRSRLWDERDSPFTEMLSKHLGSTAMSDSEIDIRMGWNASVISLVQNRKLITVLSSLSSALTD